ncbi:MAG: protein-L-isoaspartate(D-aspartate) O-methyltransferase [Thermoguttaceae bacterium]|nr:protein-L-isoaspartate(D-aspartate) O-methyltransferase [Thermoguttaceae bacterium]MDW8079353.1 protein-L-isoaspartate(D-aspartate) O-methyltransferase [Thermoguttaceae bacterium]
MSRVSSPLFQWAIFWAVCVRAVGNFSAADGQTALWFEKAREQMVAEAIIGAGIKNPRVIEAMRQTPRHEFVPSDQRHLAYYDMALPIGFGQTISPPFVVAFMTEALDPQPTDKVLEIGTGSGYQAAVLSPLVKEVYTIEIVEPLARRAAETLARLGYRNVFVKAGDGYLGWPEKAPFDKIIVTCSPESVPQPLVDQLAEGGRLVIPVGERYQQTLYLYRKEEGQLRREALLPALFVPMTGEAEKLRQIQPDPTRPAINNGDFEEMLEGTNQLAGWHYQRQLEVVRAGAPSGEAFARFVNKEPGRMAQALQGFPIDGRRVRRIRLEAMLKGEDLRPGRSTAEQPGMVILFYGEDRQEVGTAFFGPFLGTFPWTKRSAILPVPIQAREAIIRIGLLGGTGTLSVDALRLEPVGAASPRR